MPSDVEITRRRLSKQTGAAKKAQLGQYLTPEPIAAFMAGLFTRHGGTCRLLDAGAGIGSLSAAVLRRWRQGSIGFDRVELDAFEVDPSLHEPLARTLLGGSGEALTATIRDEDFIHAAVDALSGRLFGEPVANYTHAILNPPYKKIGGKSDHRLALRRVGIETVNLYTAFVALAVELLEPRGQLVAIIPRSFCNGPYFRPFRRYLLERAAIRRMHLFNARNKAFRDDNVLQENLIIQLERGARQGRVAISTSTDETFKDLSIHEHAFDRIVFADDPQCFIHVPTSPHRCAIEQYSRVRHSLADIAIEVSTGPVVDFRLKEHLRHRPSPQTVPLLYPAHFCGHATDWPALDGKKPNAIERNAETERWLLPTGFYCVVRRFSPKEERRRIVASVVDPGAFDDAAMLGIENHLNLFHEKRRGLPASLARGLAVYLNTTAVDQFFRRFNGHTQVNATDLRLMKYPSRSVLTELGEWAHAQRELNQERIDAKVKAAVQ